MEIKLPKLGEGAESGTVVNILVKEGEQISAGQTILELENEKAVAPIPAPAAGTVRQLRVQVGDQISAGHLLMVLDPAGGGEATAPERPGAPKPARAAPEAAPEPGAEGKETSQPMLAEASSPAAAGEGELSTELPPSKEPPVASPAIRRMARELGIDLRRVRGRERGGRIVIADLRAYVEQLQRIAFTAARPAPAAAPPARAKAAPPKIDFAQWGKITRQPLSPLRQTIGRRMVESWTSVPRVTQFDEADVTVLNDLRKKHAPVYEQRGAKLTVTPLILKAVVAVLKKHPPFNASLDEATNELVLKDYFHLGLAVDTEAGLLVPVIRDVDKKSVADLCREVVAVADKARERKLSLDEMKGGTFTISNQGGIGGGHFTPIVNLPEVAILGLGRSKPKPVVREGQIEPRFLLPLALSYDHRAIDGAMAARFITDLVQALENFNEQILIL